MGGAILHSSDATLVGLAKKVEQSLVESEQHEMGLDGTIEIMDRWHLEQLVEKKVSYLLDWKDALDDHSNKWFATFNVHS